MEQWNIIKAYDYCYNVTDGTHDSPKQTEFGKYLITSKHIKDNRIDFESAYKISNCANDLKNQNDKATYETPSLSYGLWSASQG